MQTTKNTVTTEADKINIPKVDIESQPRPKVDKEKLAAIKQLKDCQIKNNKIVTKR
jgi:hypothetical protein